MALKTAKMAEQLELFGCIQCGKCTGGCPVARKTVLNIRTLIYHMLVDSDMDVDAHEELWDCTSCFTCVERCPKDVQPAELVITLRGELVESGRVPETVGTALMSIFRQGNPSSMARQDRELWAEGAEESLDMAKKAAKEGCDLLYYVGCIPSYDRRVQPVARALMRTFESAGIKAGTLGTEESCCGNEVRRMGELGLFEMLVEENGDVFRGVAQNAGARQLVTTSPHCFNTFKNEYGLDGMEVLHYTQLLAHLIEDDRLTFATSVASEDGEEKLVTYHDPCFLGKQNQVFDEPRAILEAIPGVKLVEMDRNRERSLCCEGGGGRMWVEGTNLEERLAFQRVEEAAETGADILAVACPFCLLTLEDAVKVRGLDEKLQVMDIMELVDTASADASDE
ncbi:MAG: (Fe-S)-binding protein [Anaerolineae bacterium]|jgi:Fe-S oxidoreductase